MSLQLRSTGRALLLGAVLLVPAVATAADLPLEKQALLMLRALSFDRALAGRGKEAATIVVVYRDSNPASESGKTAMMDALAPLVRSATVGQRPVKVVAVAFADAASFESRVQPLGACAVYVAPGLNEALSDLSAAARRLKLLSFSASESQVRQALSVGLLLKGQKPQILVNLAASRAEGADLDSAFLKVAEVIR